MSQGDLYIKSNRLEPTFLMQAHCQSSCTAICSKPSVPVGVGEWMWDSCMQIWGPSTNGIVTGFVMESNDAF